MIRESGEFNLSVLTDAVPMSVISRFGFQSGRDCSKFEGCDCVRRSANGIRYIPKYTNAYISCKVLEARDHGTHTLFVAEVTEAVVLDKSAESVTYERYLSEIKPKPHPSVQRCKRVMSAKSAAMYTKAKPFPPILSARSASTEQRILNL